MILTSTAVMYALTYTTVFSVAHIQLSQERFYVAVIMGSAMTIVMLGFMWKMYPSTVMNAVIVLGAVLLGGLAFVFSQNQWLIGDQAYMRGMIPHHSIAILTSNRANIADLRVKKLAHRISSTQVTEIAEMKWLLADIGAKGLATTTTEANARRVPESALQD